MEVVVVVEVVGDDDGGGMGFQVQVGKCSLDPDTFLVVVVRAVNLPVRVNVSDFMGGQAGRAMLRTWGVVLSSAGLAPRSWYRLPTRGLMNSVPSKMEIKLNQWIKLEESLPQSP